MQHTTLPWPFSNTDVLLTRAQEHLAPALHQHCTSTEAWPGCTVVDANSEAAEWWTSSRNRQMFGIPRLGMSFPRSHQAKAPPSSREPTTSCAEYPSDFVLFQMLFVFLLPFPLRHLNTVRHKWAGLSTACVLLQEHNPAASSCCFPEQVTTSRRVWNKMKDPGYFFNTHKKRSVRFSLKQTNKQTKLNQINDMKLWEELTEKRKKDYTESFKLLGKKPFLPVPHSSTTVYECFTITSINSDIFSLLGYIMNTVGFNFNCCLFIFIYGRRCPQIQISGHWK